MKKKKKKSTLWTIKSENVHRKAFPTLKPKRKRIRYTGRCEERRQFHSQWTECVPVSILNPRQRPYHHVENTGSRPITEDKQHRAWLVLR
jgi:hypothetical protein